jgi:regulator of sigma E protease
MTAFMVVAALAMIIFVHELGHFIAAKLARLPVDRFSIGFPPHILKLRLGKTEYCLGAIPLGGYVKVDLGTSGEGRSDSPWPLRLITAAAGSAANFLFAILVLFLVLAVVGQDISIYPNVVGPVPNQLGLSAGDTILAVNGRVVADFAEIAFAMQGNPSGTLTVGTGSGRREVPWSLPPEALPGFEPFIEPVVGECLVGMPAYEAGLRQGDSLVSVDGFPVGNWIDLLDRVRSAEASLEIVFTRNGSLDTAYVRPVLSEGLPRIGVVARTVTQRMVYSPGRAFLYAVSGVAQGVVGFYGSLLSAFARPREFVDMSGGPVYMAEALGQQAGFGLSRLLEAIAIISIAIMCFNLLPIPLLDGGHVAFILIEGIRGKPLSGKGIQIAQQTGLLIILLLFALIMWKDLSRLFLRAR